MNREELYYTINSNDTYYNKGIIEYRHYGTPDEEQNLENEDKVDEAFDILKGE